MDNGPVFSRSPSIFYLGFTKQTLLTAFCTCCLLNQEARDDGLGRKLIFRVFRLPKLILSHRSQIKAKATLSSAGERTTSFAVPNFTLPYQPCKKRFIFPPGTLEFLWNFLQRCSGSGSGYSKFLFPVWAFSLKTLSISAMIISKRSAKILLWAKKN